LVEVQSLWPDQRRLYMHPNEQGILLNLLGHAAPRRMIELGVNEGLTARAVLDHIDSIEYYLGVDVPHDHQMPIIGQQSEVPREPGRLCLGDQRFELVLRDDATDGLILGREQFDAAFIDGDHCYAGVVADYDLARRIVRPGGWVFFHDYGNPTVEVTLALEDLRREGADLFSVRGTWLAFCRV
jgi:predicted O-methyltransferase YrrM